MKKTVYSSILILLLCVSALAQPSRLTVFTENGDRFFAYINGKLQNAGLQSNVTTKDITGQGCVLKIVFDDAGLGEKIFKLPLKSGYECRISLKKNNKGEYVMRYAGEAPLAIEEANDPPQTQVSDNNISPSSSQNPSEMESQQIHMSVNMNPGGMGVNTNVHYNQSITTTETRTQSGSTSKAPTEQATSVKKSPCSAIPPSTFNEVKQSISGKSFDETKVKEAKQVLNANCMSAKQIKDVVMLMGYEESKLDIAKYAYKKCIDPNNYFVINSAFGFEASVDELNTYIESVK